MNISRGEVRINFAKVWQSIARYRYRMLQHYIAAGQFEYAVKMQQDCADAHHIMTHYLTRLHNGTRC